jgi:hypothetical protein
MCPPQCVGEDTSSLPPRSFSGVSVMPYSGLMPSLDAIQQAVREPMLDAPCDHKSFAIYIFERAREIMNGCLPRSLSNKAVKTNYRCGRSAIDQAIMRRDHCSTILRRALIVARAKVAAYAYHPEKHYMRGPGPKTLPLGSLATVPRTP